MYDHDQFIEQLSEIATLRGFLALSVVKLHQHIDLLIQRVFRKTDFAVKSVIDSLFEHQGPLAETNVQLKLLLGLGVISEALYEEINTFSDFQFAISNEVDEPNFASSLSISYIRKLHYADLSLINGLLNQASAQENQDSMLFQMQQYRLERVIRSSLILALTQILEQLDVESPL